MEELHMTWLTWLLSSILAEFQELNTDPLSLLYKLGTLSMEKLSFCGCTEEPTSEKMKLVIFFFVSGGEKKSDTFVSIKAT